MRARTPHPRPDGPGSACTTEVCVDQGSQSNTAIRGCTGTDDRRTSLNTATALHSVCLVAAPGRLSCVSSAFTTGRSRLQRRSPLVVRGRLLELRRHVNFLTCRPLAAVPIGRGNMVAVRVHGAGRVHRVTPGRLAVLLRRWPQCHGELGYAPVGTILDSWKRDLPLRLRWLRLLR